uniref:sulfurtransferase n=1 Tax=uncultured Polaribacter sp. TaxID=174711 RepID=UPI00262A6A01|nr:sulfurtransferase [uncultured Polaribacter sp.]
MSLKIPSPKVKAKWLYHHLEYENLIIFNATIPKVKDKENLSFKENYKIKGAVFFDIKNTFSDKEAAFPNTILSPEKFQDKAQEIGVNNNSCIIVYDEIGIYSSARVWWMFQLMGFTNIAVLDGGFPAWKSKDYPVEQKHLINLSKGDFKSFYQPDKIKFTKDVIENIKNKESIVLDARSKGRFYATEPEPRNDIRGGHIPGSVSLPYSEILDHQYLKSDEDLKTIYQDLNKLNKPIIFSCGSGITAAVLALGAEIAGVKKYAVYDGSWTEWGSTNHLPIEK